MAKDKNNTDQQEQETPVDTKQLETALNERDKALDAKAQSLDDKEKALKAKEADLAKRKKALDAKEATLNEKETSLSEKEQALNEKETSLSEKKQALDEKEAALEEREKAVKTLEDKAKVDKAPKKEKPVSFKFREQEYKFSVNAPENIRILGTVMSQKEIAKDEEALVHLIGGNSSLIEKVYNNA